MYIIQTQLFDIHHRISLLFNAFVLNGDQLTVVAIHSKYSPSFLLLSIFVHFQYSLLFSLALLLAFDFMILLSPTHCNGFSCYSEKRHHFIFKWHTFPLAKSFAFNALTLNFSSCIRTFFPYPFVVYIFER